MGIEPKHNELVIVLTTDTNIVMKICEACEFELSDRRYHPQFEAQYKAMTEPGFFDKT